MLFMDHSTWNLNHTSRKGQKYIPILSRNLPSGENNLKWDAKRDSGGYARVAPLFFRVFPCLLVEVVMGFFYGTVKNHANIFGTSNINLRIEYLILNRVLSIDY